MYYTFYDIPIAKYIFRLGGVIPIASEKDSPEVKERAFREIDAALAEGDLICIFAEGELTPTGELGQFKRGVENIQKRHPGIPVYPIGISGLWGSFFSKSGKGAFKGVPKPHILGRDIVVSVAEPCTEFTSSQDLQKKVERLLEMTP
jgi:1-acyl-sn-glycerol-3-phosphate acyltransferase